MTQTPPVSPDFAAMARDTWRKRAISWMARCCDHLGKITVADTASEFEAIHAAGRAEGLEEARAAFAELDAVSGAPFEAGKDNFSPFRRAWDRLARALASDPVAGDQGTAPAPGLAAQEVERIARVLWECDCEEADEDRRRNKLPPVEKWADPWHPSGTGVRQQRQHVFRAERILAALSAPRPAQAKEGPTE